MDMFGNNKVGIKVLGKFDKMGNYSIGVVENKDVVVETKPKKVFNSVMKDALTKWEKTNKK